MSILVVEHEQECTPGRLGRILVQYGQRLNVRRLWAGEELPPDLDDTHAVVSLGAFRPMSELSRQPWFKGETALIRAAHERDWPVVGVGTGSLIVAASLGATTGPQKNGAVAIGWREVRLTFSGTIDPILTGQPWRSMGLLWQSEQVTKLPPGAAALAGTESCPSLVWRAGVRTCGFQTLIEADADDVQRWSQSRAAERQAAGLSHDEFMRLTARWMPEFDRLGERLCRCIAEYLLPSPLRRCS